jgi:ribosomal protein S18 acetylase RimI-like enzyme
VRQLSPRFRHIEVRRATAADLADIQSLAAQAWQVHLHVPLAELADWVQPVAGIRLDAPFFAALSYGRLCGFLLAVERQPEISLIGAAALDDAWSVESFLDFLLPPVVGALNSRGVAALVHMGYAPWLTETLQKHGFRLHELVITLEKRDNCLPPGRRPALACASRPGGEVDIRGASRQDLSALVAIDAAAFPPLWRNNSYAMANALVHATSFVVAEVGNEVVGYQFSHRDGYRGHVSRLVVHPEFQGRGVGSTLLAAAIETLWSQGAKVISLNTQQRNEVSQRLYSRFGFKPTGESVPVLWLSLRPAPPADEGKGAR